MELIFLTFRILTINHNLVLSLINFCKSIDKKKHIFGDCVALQIPSYLHFIPYILIIIDR